ncbi:DUF2075 domain-containing protein [Hymenobacter sp. BT559]|uniref:DUF2075 domain-containing protein n=1 Tax=Hymenobacter sp. BT559 TaxID=2795729 RepID=UPI0018EAB4B0|nr:DUF2075 domain-containing protein [Hymenobacter sp. BT559]MBJ6146292.1 DUF2075 domain-containing protein [Hymenobacter sp. BT559]
MLIYQASTDEFLQAIEQQQLKGLLLSAFETAFGHAPDPGEVRSWQNSLPQVGQLLASAGLRDSYIALEYEVPYSQNRIDCLLFGRDAAGVDCVLLLELKQWTQVQATEDEGNFVETYTGGLQQRVAHPSQQVKGYHNYLKGFVDEFEQAPPLLLFSCAYCHNYHRTAEAGLFAPVYQRLLQDFPLYTADDLPALASRLRDLLAAGQGLEVFNRFMNSPTRPSKKLLENSARVIQQKPVFSLLGEQLVAKNLIWSKVRKSLDYQRKAVVIVHGGPGTGKSVIALNVLAEAAGRHYQALYGCKSKPFIEGLQNLVGREDSKLFSNLHRFLPSRMAENQLDLLLIDEAHRVEKTSNHRFTRPADKTDLPQVDQLIRCAKTTVFFIDDRQSVRSQEVGSSALIREAASRAGCEIEEVTLHTQYRCMGSNNYLHWLEFVLGYTTTPRTLRDNEVFDFQIFDSPDQIYARLQEHEQRKPNSARLVAGFCWPWSDPNPDGSLVDDVQIGDFHMPWEAKDAKDAAGKTIRLQPGIPAWYQWAFLPTGFGQVGCIYTAQGFEFEYVGVIIGDDFRYDAAQDQLVGNVAANRDPMLRNNPARFEEHARNIYWTLLTRGMKGCYVYFTNKETEAYFRRFLQPG